MVHHKNFKERFGPWALITGGSSGIGAALSEELAQQGLGLILVARDPHKLSVQQEQLRMRWQVPVQTIAADLTTQEGLEVVKAQTAAIEIGLFVHAAGIEQHGSFEKTNPKEQEQLIALNIKSTAVLSQHFSGLMVTRGRGGLLLVSSLLGHVPSPYFATYAASKAYVLSLGVSLHAELKAKGVHVSVLSPGVTETPMAEQIKQDIDWEKMPMKVMNASQVAKEAIAQFGSKISIVPGRSNRIFALLAKKWLPYSFGLRMATLVEKAMKPTTAWV